MNLPVHPLKVLRLFAPLWLVLALSLWLHWDAWQSDLWMLAVVAFMPIVAAIAVSFVRDRWRLELTPEALVHKTLGRTERFEWARMGQVQLAPSPISKLLFGATFWFAFPIDDAGNVQEHASKAIGRRLLCVFGDDSPQDTVRRIEEWRALYRRS